MAIIDWLGGFMKETMLWFHQVTGSYGVAIILLTLLIRLVLAPLTFSQARSMVALKELQPKMKALQERYKDNPQEYQRRVMELYREQRVNPFGGCLPTLLQIPFMWALFRMLQHFQFNSPFLVWNLSQKDPYYILPALVGLTTWIQMQMTTNTADPQQRTMTTIMPIFLGWLTVGFPAGLGLYWLVSNLFSIGQQYIINKRYGLGTAGSGQGAVAASGREEKGRKGRSERP